LNAPLTPALSPRSGWRGGKREKFLRLLQNSSSTTMVMLRGARIWHFQEVGILSFFQDDRKTVLPEALVANPIITPGP
jgi:hypothetical protein